MNKKYLSYLIIAFLLFSIVPFTSSVQISNISNYTLEGKVRLLNDSLNTCLSMYNNCSKDYHDGLNCGAFVDSLKDNNKKLSDSRLFYQSGFYAIFSLLILVGLILIFRGMFGDRKAQEEN